jgi:hypothetical protein
MFAFDPERTCLAGEDLPARRHISFRQTWPASTSSEAKAFDHARPVSFRSSRVFLNLDTTVSVDTEVRSYTIPILSVSTLLPVGLSVLNALIVLGFLSPSTSLGFRTEGDVLKRYFASRLRTLVLAGLLNNLVKLVSFL